MKDVYGNPMPTNPYKKNETMKLLGKQVCEALYSDDVSRQIHDIAEARPYSFKYSSAIDIFILGYIYGKKAERARKKGGR